MRRVLITDGDQRAALAVVRSLGRAGYHCVVTSPTGRSLAGASRYAFRDLAVGDPHDAVGYVEAVRAVAASEEAALLIPITEGSLLALLPVRQTLSCPMPFPTLEAVQAICDKASVLEAATTVGIRVPRQRVATVPDSIPADLAFPVVLKPTRSVFTDPDGGRGRVGVRWARTEDEARRGLGRYPRAAFPILIQEAVEGPGIGVFVLLHGDRLVARFAHRRIREKPPSGGVSVVRQSEPMDAELLERSLALLQNFGWSGVAMVEYKRDQRTGQPVLMEINGRFWGSLQLAIDAGVDFPRLLADVSFGKPVAPVESYRFARSRWFWGDVDHVLGVWRDERSGWSDRARAVAGWARSFGPGHRSEVFRWTDPLPFLRESLHWLRHVTQARA